MLLHGLLRAYSHLSLSKWSQQLLVENTLWSSSPKSHQDWEGGLSPSLHNILMAYFLQYIMHLWVCISTLECD